MSTAPAPAHAATARTRTITVLILLAIVLIGWLLEENTDKGAHWPYQWWGVLAIAVLFVIASALAGRFWPIKLIEGADGRLSISKAQVAIWTAAVGYSYVTLYVARALDAHEVHPIDNVPTNVLLLLGMSAASAVGASAITVGKINANKIQKTAKPGPAELGDLVASDDHAPDLNKVQLLFWTLVGVAVYISLTNGALQHYFGSIDCTTQPAAGNPLIALNPLLGGGRDINCLGLPNVDTVLMILMGISHGSYLGGKLTQANIPRITGVTPMSGPPSATVVVQGADFGPGPGTISLDNRPYWGPSTSMTWDDDKISFSWPSADADGTAWVSGRTVAITVVAFGQTAQGAASFMVTTSAAL